MKSKKLIVLYVLILLFFYSCDKIDNFDGIDVSSAQCIFEPVEDIPFIEDIPVYNSADDFMYHYHNLLMDDYYVNVLQEELGYLSFGSKADTIYSRLSEKYVADYALSDYSEEEVWRDILENQYYVSTYYEEIDFNDDLYSFDETGELISGFYDDLDYSYFYEVAPALEDNVLRYMFNEKRMYFVGDYCVRYFDEGVVLVECPSLRTVADLQNADSYSHAMRLDAAPLFAYSFVNSTIVTPISLNYNDIVLGRDYIVRGPVVPESLSDYFSSLDFKSKGKVGSRVYRLRCILNTYSNPPYWGGCLYNHAVTLDVRNAKLVLGFWWRVNADVFVEPQNYVVSDNVRAYSEYFEGILGYETYKRRKYLMAFYELDYIPSSLGLRFIGYNGRITANFNGEVSCVVDIDF